MWGYQLKLNCLHGYFIFEENASGQISEYMSLTGLSLVKKNNYYTFQYLLDSPRYSLAGKNYLNLPATKTFEGNEWEVFEENGFIYDFTLNLLVPIQSVFKKTTIKVAGNRFISPGLILPGSITDDGSRVKGYSAWYSKERATWLYSEVSYV